MRDATMKTTMALLLILIITGCGKSKTLLNSKHVEKVNPATLNTDELQSETVVDSTVNQSLNQPVTTPTNLPQSGTTFTNCLNNSCTSTAVQMNPDLSTPYTTKMEYIFIPYSPPISLPKPTCKISLVRMYCEIGGCPALPNIWTGGWMKAVLNTTDTVSVEWSGTPQGATNANEAHYYWWNPGAQTISAKVKGPGGESTCASDPFTVIKW